MEYSIIIISEGKELEVVNGNDVNSAHQKASEKMFRYKYPIYNLIDYSEIGLQKEKNCIKKDLALQTTKNIQSVLAEEKRILENSINSKIDLWFFLQESTKTHFDEQKPQSKEYPSEPEYFPLPPKPNITDPKYKIKKTLIDNIRKEKFVQKKLQVNNTFEEDLKNWDNSKNEIEIKNQELKRIYDKQIAEIKNELERAILDWEKRKIQFEKNNKKTVETITFLKNEYLSLETSAIETYNYELLRLISNNRKYYKFECDITYNPTNKIIAIEYLLPDIDSSTSVCEVKYVASKDIFEEKYLSKKDFQALYDEVIYQLTLSTINDIFKHDEVNAIDSIIFNGYIKTIDKSNGKNIQPYIISLLVSKDEFAKINLSQVDAKQCFKNLKGVSASALSSQTAIAPIIKIDKKDKRFINNKDIVNDIDNSTNLAAMDWEDFEHLIRELFEKEFSTNGGEVKVTQASRDGGVDAIAFDPDPIRGGKIVIQAKRYTNTVGVSAVRDLYGTVMNEGATKGILVSTADYGPDAYEFAKGKPLTLLNGANLLYLLEKHGHKAKIDLMEAKKILSEK
ncbi:MAG: restriction endonuclease [Ignavibacteriales bacterium]|nr:restriction endonuclease [Ignavibacteriales bacterium]